MFSFFCKRAKWANIAVANPKPQGKAYEYMFTIIGTRANRTGKPYFMVYATDSKVFAKAFCILPHICNICCSQ
jgi:hypothetical protein